MNSTVKGFSLFELVVYIAIFSIVIISVVSIATRSIASKTKALATQEVEQTTRFALQRITSDVRSAVDIDETAFVSNVLTLTMIDGSIITYSRSSNAITIERNGGGAVQLTSGDVSVDEFVLQNNTGFGTEYKDITVNIATSTSSASNRPEYVANFELTSTVSLRQ